MGIRMGMGNGVVKIEEARQPEKAYAWNNPFEKRGNHTES
jgi:hypothetical protein